MSYHNSMHFYDRQTVTICHPRPFGCGLLIRLQQNNSEEDNNGANKTDLNVCELHTTEDASQFAEQQNST